MKRNTKSINRRKMRDAIRIIRGEPKTDWRNHSLRCMQGRHLRTLRDSLRSATPGY